MNFRDFCSQICPEMGNELPHFLSCTPRSKNRLSLGPLLAQFRTPHYSVSECRRVVACGPPVATIPGIRILMHSKRQDLPRKSRLSSTYVLACRKVLGCNLWVFRFGFGAPSNFCRIRRWVRNLEDYDPFSVRFHFFETPSSQPWTRTTLACEESDLTHF
jgi:hypothetical protein